MRIAVLGTGSSSIAFVVRLLEDSNSSPAESVSIDVVDFGSLKQTDHRYRAPGVAGKPMAQRPDALYVPPIFNTVSHLDGEVAGSSSFGGWSNIWGATIEKYPDSHLRLWEDERADLNDSYNFLEKRFVHFDKNETEDSDINKIIVRILPHYLAEPKAVDTLVERFQQKPSSLAIRKFSTSQIVGCNQCGLCLEGCPGNHIWSSSLEWNSVFERDNVKLIDNVWIERVTETDKSVMLTIVSPSGDRSHTFYDRIFIGLGALQTAALMLRSGLSRTEEVRVKDSQMSLVPLIRRNFCRTGDGNPRVGFADGFISVTNRRGNVGPSEFFAQIYCYSNSMQTQFEREFLLLRLIPRKFLAWLLKRFAVAMCFFDQDLSGEISITVLEDKVTIQANEKVKLSSPSPKFLKKSFRFSDFKPIPFFTKASAVGLGYHFGASFPMSFQRCLQTNSSDSFGRPNGLLRTHIIDSSVLPRISAFPITFTTMANAVRIASHFQEFKDMEL